VSITVYQRRKRKKADLMEDLKKLFKEYRNFVVVGITGVEDSTLQRARVVLRALGRIKIVKNTITRKVITSLPLENNTKQLIEEVFEGQNAIVFTNESTFDVVEALEKFSRNVCLKPNRIAPVDVLIPAGVTTLQPGPLTDSLTALNVPFEVKKNLVYIKSPTPVLRKGELVNSRVAELLRELDIKPLVSRFAPKCGLDGGLYIAGEKLVFKKDDLIGQLGAAYEDALSLAFNAYVPVPEVIPLLLTKASNDAISLALEAGVVTPETLPALLVRATRVAEALVNATAH